MPGTRWESAFQVFFILFLPQHPSVIHFRAPDVSGARFPCHRQSLYCKVFEIKNYFSFRLSDLTSSSLKISLPPYSVLVLNILLIFNEVSCKSIFSRKTTLIYLFFKFKKVRARCASDRTIGSEKGQMHFQKYFVY